MPHRIMQPTKEQVRAYMAEREAARRPPPPPEEIRRQLNWRLAPPEDDYALVQFYLIPSTYSQLAARIALHWLFIPVHLVPRRRDQ
jgi:hypothetical protein